MYASGHSPQMVSKVKKNLTHVSINVPLPLSYQLGNQLGIRTAF